MALGARIARSTVQDYLHRIAASGLDHEQLLALDDKTLDEKLFPPRESRNTARPLPDWEMIEQQLRGRGVTLRLLWQEFRKGRRTATSTPSSCGTSGSGNRRRARR